MITTKKLSLMMSILTLLMSTQVWAEELAQRNPIRNLQGMRPMGMGGAFSAVDGSDENALFYNPAAINDLPKEVHMQFLLPTVVTSYKAIPFIASDVMDLADDIDAAGTDAAKIDVFNQFATQNTGRYEEVGVSGSIANFMHKYLAASLFYENRSVVALTNPASSTIDIETVSQGGLMFGSAYGFFDDKLQVGAAVKVMERHLIDETITQRDVISNTDFGDILDTNEYGFGVGVDIGIQGKLPLSGKTWDYLDPTLAVTLQDIADTRFTGNVGRQQQSLTAGFALHPNFWKLKNNLAVDFRDLDHRGDILTKLYAGIEFSYPDIGKVLRTAAVRVGASQGYLTAGFGLDFRYFKINAATWGRELALQTSQKQSRMFGLQLAAGF